MLLFIYFASFLFFIIMDLLEKLNLVSLPEQQTRLSYPNISNALDKDPNIRLGFDVCCVCAKSLEQLLPKLTVVTCKGCRRITYCSPQCRKTDANPDDNDDTALGHSALVCSLLRLCNLDEAMEDKCENCDEDNKGKITQEQTKGAKKKSSSLTKAEQEEAAYRVRSEYESYPATLANILSDGPCYKQFFSRNATTFTIHIVGSQEGAEFRSKKHHDDDFTTIYKEAFTDILLQSSLATLHLIFIGPSCPISSKRQIMYISRGDDKRKDNTNCRIIFDIVSKNYHELHFGDDASSLPENTNTINNPEKIPRANTVVFFNPGFTCPDYGDSWELTLKCLPKSTTSNASFLVATNTEMEAIFDCQTMYQNGLIPVLPSWASEDDCISDDEDLSNSSSFFGENPYCGLRVRQSGNMANDLFVKNRWIFGAPLSLNDGIRTQSLHISTTKIGKKGNKIMQTNDCNSISTEQIEQPKQKKPKKAENRKINNPALI